MKKNYLIALIMTTMSLYANAQQRMVLYEEVTSDNNASCATANPPFWALCNTGSNPTEMIQIAYMASIPTSADSFYYQDSAVTNNRLRYYATSYAYTHIGGAFAPSGFRDGLTPDVDSGLPGNPAYYNQSDIDSEYANPASFNLAVTNTWNATYDSVYTSVTVSCMNAYNHPGANFMLRLALVETVNFTTPPGSDGETHFQHVVRSMYPNANGTNVGGVWALGATNTYTFVCAVPGYVDKSASPFMVAWLQNDSTMFVEQSGVGTALTGLAYDAASVSTNGPGFVCTANGAYTATHSVLLQNDGTSTLTTATIYTSVDGGAYTSYSWTGSLATTASVTVTIPVSVTVAGASSHTIKDSVAMPDGHADLAPGNNVSHTTCFIESTTLLAMPFTTGFETGDNQFYSDNITNDSEQWKIYATTMPTAAHRGSFAASYQCFNYNTGDAAVLTMPEIDNTVPSALDFWVAYAQYGSAGITTGDTLSVVYSTNCGVSWTTLWSANGTGLATVAYDSLFYQPTDSSNYVQHSISLNTVPTGAIVGFRGASGYGNNIWLDDINIRVGPPLGVQQVTSTNTGLNLFPNPATNTLNITSSETIKQITITNIIGKTVATHEYNSENVQIDLSGLSSGVYFMKVNGTEVRKFVKE